MVDDTVEEQPVTSVADDLKAAFAELDESALVEQEAASEGADGVAVDVADVDAGESVDVSEQEAAAEPEPITAPEHWSAEDKAAFESAPREVQEWALRRHKAMEGDYTRKMQEHSDFLKTWTPVQEAIAPYVDQLRQIGTTPVQYLKDLASADQMLSRDPVAGIQWVANKYGVDLGQIAQGHAAEGGQENASPEVNQIRQELDRLRHSMMAEQQAKAEASRNEQLQSIEAFAGETDEGGNPLRPYFDEVMPEMVLMARAEQASGQTPKLADLYDRAVWANPEVRQKILAAEKAAEAKKAEEAARAKAAEAQRASVSVDGGPGATVPAEDLSIREQLMRQMS